jgi:hypothetical protein
MVTKEEVVEKFQKRIDEETKKINALEEQLKTHQSTLDAKREAESEFCRIFDKRDEIKVEIASLFSDHPRDFYSGQSTDLKDKIKNKAIEIGLDSFWRGASSICWDKFHELVGKDARILALNKKENELLEHEHSLPDINLVNEILKKIEDGKRLVGMFEKDITSANNRGWLQQYGKRMKEIEERNKKHDLETEAIKKFEEFLKKEVIK